MYDFCIKCGEKKLEDNTNYCLKCGSPLFPKSQNNKSTILLLESVDQDDQPNQLEELNGKIHDVYVKNKKRVYIGAVLFLVALTLDLTIFNRAISSISVIPIEPIMVIAVIIILTGLRRKGKGIMLNLIGVVLVVLTSLIVIFYNVSPEFVELKIDIGFILIIIWVIAFHLPGMWILMNKGKNRFLLLILSLIFCTILSSMPLFLFLPIEWLDLSFFISALLLGFWILLIVIPGYYLLKKNEKKIKWILWLDLIGIMIYVGMVIYIPIKYSTSTIYTPGYIPPPWFELPDLNFRDFFFDNLWNNILIGFGIGFAIFCGVLLLIVGIGIAFEDLIDNIKTYNRKKSKNN
ncbi:MAG: hypothetical protein ACFFBP_00305 [Promethearchaeota archaeon]